MELFTQLIDIIKFHVPEITAFLVGTGLLSLLIQKVKQWLTLESGRTIYLLTAAMGLLSVLFQAVLTSGAINVKQLGTHGAVVLATLQFIYIYCVKPAGKLLDEVKAVRDGKQTTTVSATQVVSPTEASTVVTQTISSANPEFNA